VLQSTQVLQSTRLREEVPRDSIGGCNVDATIAPSVDPQVVRTEGYDVPRSRPVEPEVKTGQLPNPDPLINDAPPRRDKRQRGTRAGNLKRKLEAEAEDRANAPWNKRDWKRASAKECPIPPWRA